VTYRTILNVRTLCVKHIHINNEMSLPFFVVSCYYFKAKCVVNNSLKDMFKQSVEKSNV